MKKILPIIVVVAIVGIGAYLLLTGGSVSLTGGGINISKTAETFSGTLKLAVEKGIPLKCTYKVNDQNFGTGYIKGKKYLGEGTINGQQGHVLLVDNCMWSWTEGKTQGAKMCFEPTNGKSIWDQQGAGDIQYTCSPAVITDAMFVPPTNIQFMEINQ